MQPAHAVRAQRRCHRHPGSLGAVDPPPPGDGEVSSPMFTIASLWIPFTIIAALGQVARNAMQRQLTGPLGTWGATNIRFLFGFPFSIVFFAVVIVATGDARAVADGGVLAVAAARRAQPDRRHRPDAAGDERPLLRGDDGLPEDRGDPDRDLRLRLSRRSSDRAEGDRDRDRHRRRGHHRAAAGRRKGFCRTEADHHRPGRRRLSSRCRRSAFAAPSSRCPASRS